MTHTTLLARAATAGALALAAVTAAGCHSAYMLRMDELPPIDETTLSPKLGGRKYAKVMMIRPSGEAGKEFDAVVPMFEAEFLRQGITVISGAITGRVVLKEAVRGEGGQGATQLSDIERALVMAKETGAEAIVQIGTWGWTEASQPFRYFVADKGTRSFRECSVDEWKEAPSSTRWTFGSPRLDFVGKLIDVDSAEVVAVFQCHTCTNRAFGRRYEAQIGVMRGGGSPPVLQAEAFPYLETARSAEVRGRCARQLIEIIARHFATAG